MESGLTLDAGQANWTRDADLVVVGGGIAGICAAIEARSRGASILVIERASGAGGTSALSSGQFYLGGGTAVQEACGISDSADEMFKYLMAVSPNPDPEKIWAYSQGSVEHFNWLEAQGLRFERSFLPDKLVISPGTEGLIYNGNEKVWPFRIQAKPAARGHKVAIVGDTGGGWIMRVLLERAAELGVEPLCDARVRALYIDDHGAVQGVKVQSSGTEMDIRCDKGLLLATGGFAFNPEMVAQYAPLIGDWVSDLHGTPNDDGFGILAGVAAGGCTQNMDGAQITSPIYPPGDRVKGIIVNKLGRRFVSEDSYHARTAAMTAMQPDLAAYLILDSSTFSYPVYEMQPFIDGWETVQEMETALGIPDGALQHTLAEYNRHAVNGADPVLHKTQEWLQPLDKPPYAAFDLSYGQASYVAGMTLGGLRISGSAQVLRDDGCPIPKLYAAGACSSAIAQHGINYASGMPLGQASFFGRRAALHALSGESS